MRSGRIFILLIYLFFAAFSRAADLPKLPANPAVTKGKLPNGMAYYIVSNPSSKGMADFALVQRTGTMTSSDIAAIDLSKDVLAGLPQIGNGISPQKFFSSNGVNPTADGFVRVEEESTIYHFSDMLLAPNTLDSALVVLVGMVDKLAKDQDAGKWYAPADNAIVISGDVDPKVLAANLKMISYLIPSMSSQQRNGYAWVSKEVPQFIVKHDDSTAISEVKAIWRAPRVPAKYSGTLQPYIQKMYVAQLGETAVSRIKKSLTERGVPYATVSYRHISSADVSGDENFVVRIVVGGGNCEAAVEVLAETMSALESAGASGEELEIARKKIINSLSAGIQKPLKSNSYYVDMCAHSFLYGTSLVNEAEVLKAYTSHSIDLEREQRLFRGVADALLDPYKDFTLICRSSDRLDSSDVEKLFHSAWKSGVNRPVPENLAAADTLLALTESPKVSLKLVKKDPMSGGSIWTFTNGFKVVYKKMDTAGKLYWSMGLNGGYGSISDLEVGEGAFVGDLLGLYRVAGMKGEDFRKYLELGNVDMNVRVGLASTVISGTVYKDNVRLMLRALAALANEREPDSQAFDEYLKNERFRLSASVGTKEDRKAVIDSLMCPDYKYSQIKSRGKLSEGLAAKADRFYDDRFSSMNNGVLVLVGDIDETVLKKELIMRVGAFRTRKSAFYRPAVSYQPVSGWSTHTASGKENSVYMALSVQLPLTVENKMASEIAAMVLKKSLSKKVDATGMYVDVSSNTKINPQERFNVMISIKEASEKGFAEGVQHSGALEALRIVRSTLNDLGTTEVTDAVVKAYKEWVKNDLTYRMKSPQYWVSAITMRQLEGKDFSTDYKARIDAVTTDKVKQILTSLNNASKVEFIISK